MSPVSPLVPWYLAKITILFGDPLGQGSTSHQVHHPPMARVALSGRLSLITLARLQVYHQQHKYSSIIGLLTRYVLRVPRSTPDLLNILTQCTHITDDDWVHHWVRPAYTNVCDIFSLSGRFLQKLQIFSKKMASYFTTILGRYCSKSKL